MKLCQLFPLGVELLILNIILWFTANKLVFVSFSDTGDVAFGLITMYILLFLIGSIFYAVLRFGIRKPKPNAFLTLVITVSLTLFVYFSFTITLTALVWRRGIILLTIIPLVVLGARYLFLKLLTDKKQRSA